MFSIIFLKQITRQHKNLHLPKINTYNSNENPNSV